MTDPAELRELLDAYSDHRRRRPIRYAERADAPPLDDGATWPTDDTGRPVDAAYIVTRRTRVDERNVTRTCHATTRQLAAVRWVLADAEGTNR